MTRRLNDCYYVWLFGYNNGNKKKYTKFHHTEGFTHYESSHISLQVIKLIRNRRFSLVWTFIWVSRDCVCLLKLVTVGLTHWEKKLNLKLFDVRNRKFIMHLKIMHFNRYTVLEDIRFHREPYVHDICHTALLTWGYEVEGKFKIFVLAQRFIIFYSF